MRFCRRPTEWKEKDAPPLSGLSFWRNFTFKIDNEKAKLTMSKIDVPEKTPRPPHGRKTTAE